MASILVAILVIITLNKPTQGVTIQTGNASLSGIGSETDNFMCKRVFFPERFSTQEVVQVHVSVSHGQVFQRVHGASVPWVESVTNRSFKGCVVKTGESFDDMAVLNWLAFQGSPMSLRSGSVLFGLLSTGTQCGRVKYEIPFNNKPRVFATPRHQVIDRKQDATFFWVEDSYKNLFKICLREVRNMDGLHENITVDWFAYDASPRSWSLPISENITFTNEQAPRLQNNLAYCKNVNFSLPFLAPPVVVVSASRMVNSSSIQVTSTSCSAINVWIEEVTHNSFRPCVKDLVAAESSHVPIAVDYLVVGIVDPCFNVTCSYYAVCKVIGPFEHRCECVDKCPSYDEPVCSSNGTAFKNTCSFQREVCNSRRNDTLQPVGLCIDFPIEIGRGKQYNDSPMLRSIRSTKETSFSTDEAEASVNGAVRCEVIRLFPGMFSADKPVHVQATVSHFNSTKPLQIHEAIATWVENVKYDQFTACFASVRHGERPSFGQANFYWIAYQGAPDRGVAGRVTLLPWWSGTTCQRVSLPPDKFSSKPTVLATVEHLRLNIKHDAAYLWLEDVNTNSFRICLREMQNFDGFHADIFVNWIAFESLRNPMFSEHKYVYFPNLNPPTYLDDATYCKNVKFKREYGSTPAVLLSASHSTGGGRLDPLYNTITAWLENINTTGFRTCIKELYVNKYDPVSVAYAVFGDVCAPGWSYFNGVCILNSRSCANWTGAERACSRRGARLVTIRHQEENVYVQKKHNGASVWLGLVNRNSNGEFALYNGTSNFTFWKRGEPRSVRTCAVALGVTGWFRWSPVNCDECHQFTCAADCDECSLGTHACHRFATCRNTYGSYTCSCRPGYAGNGIDCADIDECSATINPCVTNAKCRNTVGSYQCSCKTGFVGNGVTCLGPPHRSPMINGRAKDVEPVKNGGSVTATLSSTVHLVGTPPILNSRAKDDGGVTTTLSDSVHPLGTPRILNGRAKDGGNVTTTLSDSVHPLGTPRILNGRAKDGGNVTITLSDSVVVVGTPRILNSRAKDGGDVTAILSSSAYLLGTPPILNSRAKDGGDVTTTLSGSVHLLGTPRILNSRAKDSGNVTATLSGSVHLLGTPRILNSRAKDGGDVTTTPSGSVHLLGTPRILKSRAKDCGNVTATLLGSVHVLSTPRILNSRAKDGGYVTTTPSGSVHLLGTPRILNGLAKDGGDVTTTLSGFVHLLGTPQIFNSRAKDGGYVTATLSGSVHLLGTPLILNNRAKDGGNVTTTPSGSVLVIGTPRILNSHAKDRWDVKTILSGSVHRLGTPRILNGHAKDGGDVTATLFGTSPGYSGSGCTTKSAWSAMVFLPAVVTLLFTIDLDECTLGSHTCDSNAVCNNIVGSYTCTCKTEYTGDGLRCKKRFHRGLEKSVILQHSSDYLEQLTSWLSPVLKNLSSKWKICWRGSSDGFAASTFHFLCNNKGPTVTIVQVGSYVFGGYTDQSWTSEGAYSKSEKSFLFTLYNTHGYRPQKLPQYRNLDRAIYSSNSCGPTFGGGHDLKIRDQANSTTGSYTFVGYTYKAPDGCSFGACFVLAGKYNSFNISNIEVFYETT